MFMRDVDDLQEAGAATEAFIETSEVKVEFNVLWVQIASSPYPHLQTLHAHSLQSRGSMSIGTMPIIDAWAAA
jgi:hypothetical protein